MLVKPEDLFWFLKFVSLWLFFFPSPFVPCLRLAFPFSSIATRILRLSFHTTCTGTLTWPWRRAACPRKWRDVSPASAGPSSAAPGRGPGTGGLDTRPGNFGPGDRTPGWLASGSFPWREEHKGTHTQKDKQSQVFQRYPQRRWILWFGCGWSTGFGPKLCL